MLRRCFLRLAIPIITLLSVGFSAPLQSPEQVSMIQLISNPTAYHGKLVQVIGFVRFEFEGNALYLHEEDYKQMLTRNGVWLSMAEKRELDQKYALIEGVFNASNRGHLGLWSGSIERVSRSQEWPPKRP
jgi:hypothetical protein